LFSQFRPQPLYFPIGFPFLCQRLRYRLVAYKSVGRYWMLFCRFFSFPHLPPPSFTLPPLLSRHTPLPALFQPCGFLDHASFTVGHQIPQIPPEPPLSFLQLPCFLIPIFRVCPRYALCAQVFKGTLLFSFALHDFVVFQLSEPPSPPPPTRFFSWSLRKSPQWTFLGLWVSSEGGG